MSIKNTSCTKEGQSIKIIKEIEEKIENLEKNIYLIKNKQNRNKINGKE